MGQILSKELAMLDLLIGYYLKNFQELLGNCYNNYYNHVKRTFLSLNNNK